jgi:hypothetical protein
MEAVLRLIAAALIAGVHPSPPPLPVPSPIGRGPGYELPAARGPARVGAAIGDLRCTASGGPWSQVHVEVFARGKVVIIPPGVGVAPPRVRLGAEITRGRCSYPARTTDPTGVVDFRSGMGLTLGDVFAIWGQPLSRHRLCGYRARRPVRLYVDGRQRADLRSAPLRRHAEIVVEVGRFVPPHASYLFPPAGRPG